MGALHHNTSKLALDRENCFTVDKVTEGVDGGLVAAGDDEDVWAYNDRGEKWAVLGTLPTATADEFNSED